jgi:hypothetical protein
MIAIPLPPAVPEIVVRDGAVFCPHCDQRDTIQEVDCATRGNPGEFTIENGRIVAVFWKTGDGNFETTGYECNNCMGPVLIPNITDIDQDWC